jgi:hypothetical protein
MDEILDAAGSFNTCLKFLARAYSDKKKGTFEEEKALRTNKRLSILVATDPVFLIENSGPYFLKYATVIQCGNWDELLNLDFKDEKEHYGNTEDGSKHTYKAMDGKIAFIKRVFVGCEDNERNAIVDKMQIMLSEYCKYAIAVKKSKYNQDN